MSGDCARCGYSKDAHDNDSGYYNQCESFVEREPRDETVTALRARLREVEAERDGLQVVVTAVTRWIDAGGWVAGIPEVRRAVRELRERAALTPPAAIGASK